MEGGDRIEGVLFTAYKITCAGGLNTKVSELTRGFTIEELESGIYWMDA